MTMDGTVPSSLSAVVFGFVIVCIFMSRTNMLRELMAYGRCDNNNSEQRTATVHETIAANDVSFAYFRLRLIDSQFKWHKSKLCYVVCRNFKSIFSNSNDVQFRCTATETENANQLFLKMESIMFSLRKKAQIVIKKNLIHQCGYTRTHCVPNNGPNKKQSRCSFYSLSFVLTTLAIFA